MRNWIIAAVIGVVALAAGVGIGVAVANGSDDSSKASSVGAYRQVCQDWMGDYQGRGMMSGSMMNRGGQWCDDWASWMHDQMHSGSATMMGPMMMGMWGGDPDQMRDACQSWATSTGAADSTQWCADMATWMGSHMNGSPGTSTTATTPG